MIIDKLRKNQGFRLSFITTASFLFNGAYAIGNFSLGFINDSYWFITMGAYFLTLCLARIGCASALRSKNEKKIYVSRLVGLLFIILCIVLAGSVILSDRLDVVKPMGKIIMIAIAAFTTAKTTVAAVNIVKARKSGNAIWVAIRNISCADAAASILTMQRTMLVTFGEMALYTVRLMNILTGAGVCIFVLALGILSFKAPVNKEKI